MYLMGFLAAHYPGLFHLVEPLVMLFMGDDMGAIGILLWGVIVSSPLFMVACLGGRFAVTRATQWKTLVES